MAEPIAERPTPRRDGTGDDEVQPGDTAVLPVEQPTEELQPASREVASARAPGKKRQRWVGWLLAGIIFVGLLVAAFFVADSYVRDYAKDYVRERIVEVLGLDANAAVDVDLGPGSIILQALTGAIDEVSVDLEKLAFGDVIGDATLVATGVPLDGTQPVDTLQIEATIGEESVRSLAGFLSGLELESIELEEGIIAIGTEFSVFGLFTIPVGVDLLPSAVEGGISFDPQTVTLGQDDISVADLRNNPELSGLAGQFLASRDFCVAEYLPEALVVDGVAVVGSNLVVSINGDGVALSGPDLSTMGTCP
jgi:hypothetical protein